MKNLTQVQEFMREYIADEWTLHYETQIGDMEQTSFETARNTFFQKYFVDDQEFFKYHSHGDKYIRNEKFRAQRKSKPNFWRDEAYELFLIKQYQLPTGKFLFRAYISGHSRPRPELNVTTLLYNDSLFIVENEGQLKIIAKYRVDDDFALVTSRDKVRMQYLTERNHLLFENKRIAWTYMGGEVITPEMIQNVVDGVRLVQPSLEHGHATDYLQPIPNDKLGELDLNTLDLAKEVESELRFGSRTGRHSGLPNYDWVQQAHEAASPANKQKIQTAVFSALTDQDVQLRMEALALLGAKPEILSSQQYLELLQNHFDLFNNQRHPLDPADRNRGSELVVLVANHTMGEDKIRALETIRAKVYEPTYMMSCIPELFYRDSQWFEKNMTQIREKAADMAAFDAKMESLTKIKNRK